MDAPSAPSPILEIVVRNGRQQGARRRLKGPITIVGAAKGCDVRLDVDNVRPIHCLIAVNGDGPHLRSWSADDTLVNGEPVTSRILRDEDVLRVGPFEFDIHFTAPLAVPVDEFVASPTAANEQADADASKILTPQPRSQSGTGEPDFPSSLRGRAGHGFFGMSEPAGVPEVVPMALPEIPPPEPVDQAAVDEKIQRLVELQQQLGDARASYRRERAEHESDVTQQIHSLVGARNEMEKREADAVRQQSRLMSLRGRFIKRWKKHWSTQRELLQMRAEQVAVDQARLDQAQTTFEFERDRFEIRAEVENRRIEHGWEQLRAAERLARNEWVRKQAIQDQRQTMLDDQQAQINAESLALRTERMRMEHHSAQLRIEADGMESRVVNLRAVLLHLEGQRDQLGPPHGNSSDAPHCATMAEPVSADEAIQQRWETLDRMAEGLNDQWLALAEQVNRLGEAREAWRAEEAQLVDEMAALVEQLRRREEQVAEEEMAIGFEREQLEQDAASQRQLQDRLEVRQVRLETIEGEWRSELGCREVDVQQRRRKIERRENALQELCRRWSERRRREVVELREEHRRCEQARRTWAEQLARNDLREKTLDALQVELATRDLVLAKTREQFLAGTGRPEAAKRRLERLGRRLQTSRDRAEAKLTERWQTVEAERDRLNDLLRRANEQIEESEIKQRVAVDRLADLERREYFVFQSENAIVETQTAWSNQREMLERDRADLRHEIDRLARFLIDSGEPDSVPLARAA